MESQSKFAEINQKIFQGQDPGCVLWQPRIDFWYAVNKKRGTLPGHLAKMSLLDLYDYCHASIRYFTSPMRVRYRNVQVQSQWIDDVNLRRTWETPVGTLYEVLHYDEYRLSGYNTEYRLKTPEDFRIYEYILRDEEWYWDQKTFEQDLENVQGRGSPQFYFRRSPIQGLFIETMGFENTVFMMADHPEVIERYAEIASQADHAMYEVLCNCPVTILNFGENIDAHMDPPPIWRKYLLPYYNDRVAQLHAAGKRTYIHIDGAMRPILKEINESTFDGIEACTPLPQGDVTLEEIQIALGDKILIDGIPAVYFLPSFSFNEMMDCARKVVEMFSPRLVLGVSDEVPPDSDIERVRMVGEFVAGLS